MNQCICWVVVSGILVSLFSVLLFSLGRLCDTSLPFRLTFCFTRRNIVILWVSLESFPSNVKSSLCHSLRWVVPKCLRYYFPKSLFTVVFLINLRYSCCFPIQENTRSNKSCYYLEKEEEQSKTFFSFFTIMADTICLYEKTFKMSLKC